MVKNIDKQNVLNLQRYEHNNYLSSQHYKIDPIEATACLNYKGEQFTKWGITHAAVPGYVHVPGRSWEILEAERVEKAAKISKLM